MLSDYMERLLPTARQTELETHLETCKVCSQVLRDLQTTLEVAGALPSQPLGNEAALRIAEACQAGSRAFSPATASRWAFVGLVPLLLIASMLVLFPGLFPGLAHWRSGNDESQFVRFFPMLEGATEIIEEHGNWLHVREPAMRSLWEEGGISPEEFEKSFTGKPTVGEEAK